MPRKQLFTIKQEPEDSMEFGDLFPMVHHFSFSSFTKNETYGMESMESTSPEPISPESTSPESTSPKESSEIFIPALWSIEKGKIDDEYPEGVPPHASLATFGVTKEEVVSKFIPPPRQLPHDVMDRAEDMKEQENNYLEDFIEAMLNKYPVDGSYHANKARKYSFEQDISSDEANRRQRTQERKSNNDRSMESRYRKKVERAVNAYTVLHLRERILEYQTRMNFMKELLLQTNSMDEQSDDLSSFDESDMESMESLSSISSHYE